MVHISEISEIREPLLKVLVELKKNKDEICGVQKSAGYDHRITVEHLANMTSNHLTTVDYKRFGITELDGWKIRAFFQRIFDREHNEYIIRGVHNEFPDFFEPERKQFMDHVNEYRLSCGLKPLRDIRTIDI